MIATCHCGAVTLTLPGKPETLTDCNCSTCRKRGVLWGYFDPAMVRITGTTTAYTRPDLSKPALDTLFCPQCGVTTHWLAKPQFPQTRMGVNMRLVEEALLRGIPLWVTDGANWARKGKPDVLRPVAPYVPDGDGSR